MYGRYLRLRIIDGYASSCTVTYITPIGIRVTRWVVEECFHVAFLVNQGVCLITVASEFRLGYNNWKSLLFRTGAIRRHSLSRTVLQPYCSSRPRIVTYFRLASFPALVVMMITPFAAREPYKEAAAASFNTVMLSISSGSRSLANWTVSRSMPYPSLILQARHPRHIEETWLR